MAKFYPVGTKVNFDGFLLEVKEQTLNRPSCKGCFFTRDNLERNGLKEISCYLHSMDCTKHQRKDKKHVVFKLMEK